MSLRILDIENVCTACGACASVCPKDALSVTSNSNRIGFYYPNVDESKCVHCGLCEKVCPKNIIQLQGGKPIWTKDDCACCLGCLHRCPKQAIQYGKKSI